MSKNSGPGMRILWIPGRKKSNRKGIYSSTGKNVNYNSKKIGLNPTWSLGGAKVQRGLLKDDLIDEEGLGGSTASALLTTAAASSGIALADNLHNASIEKPQDDVAKDPETECKIDENIDPLGSKEFKGNINNLRDVLKSLENNENVCIEKSIDNKIELNETFNIRKKFKTFEESENCCGKECSKESLNYLNSKQKKAVTTVKNNIHDIEVLPDDDISASSSNSKKKRKKNKKKRNKTNKDETREDDDKFVKCLYYTLMCCECTIS